MIEVKRQQVMLIAGLGVLVLGAGSYFLLAGGSAPTKSDDTVAQAMEKKVRDEAPERPKIKRQSRMETTRTPDKIQRRPRTERPESRKQTRPSHRPKSEKKKTLPTNS